MTLYCVLVSSDRPWGRTEVSVQPGHHQVWEAKDEDELNQMIWDERCSSAESVDPAGEYVCYDCGEISEDCCECDSCESDSLTWELEDWSEHVEKNSHSEYVEYDPTNKQHALCTNFRNSTARPEHIEALAEKKEQDRLRAIERLDLELKKRFEVI